MPNIRTYNAPDLGLRPSETGIESTAAAARRVGSEFNEVAGATQRLGAEVTQLGSRQARALQSFGQVGTALGEAGAAAVKWQEHREISQGIESFSKFRDENDKAWNEISSSPDLKDQSLATNFMGQLENGFQKLKDGFLTEGGQLWATRHIVNMREHYQQRTSADMITRSSESIRQGSIETLNNYSNSAFRSPDFHNVDDLINNWTDNTKTLFATSPSMKGAKSAEARDDMIRRGVERIVKSGVIGAIQKSNDPEATLSAWTDKYPDHISGPELIQLAKAAKVQNKQNQLTQKALEREQRDTDTREAHADMNQNWLDNVSFDENGRASIKPGYFKGVTDAVRKHPDADVLPRADALIKWGQEQLKEKKETVVSDGATRTSLYTGLFSADNPKTDVDIMKASFEHKLDPRDTADLLKIYKLLEERPLKDVRYKTTIEAVKSGYFGDSPQGHLNFKLFVDRFVPEYLKQERSGTLQPNALSLTDPESLISKSLEGLKLDPITMQIGHAMKSMGLESPAGTDEMIRALSVTPRQAPKAAGGGAQAAPLHEPRVRPASLAGRRLNVNSYRKQYKDIDTGEIFDWDGNPVKK